MTILGWGKHYAEILHDFQYSKKNDERSAKLLNSILKKTSTKNLKQKIQGNVVFVVGAGPSLLSSIKYLKKYNVTKIVADGASKALLENNIVPDVIVTDLDGDINSLKKIARSKTIFVVHAHGDNSEKLNIASIFKNCIGTTQTKQFGKLYNFGGFTDGDRSVFLATHFHAKKIVLFGMDFGNKIGKYSKYGLVDKKVKLRKLSRGKKLLEWLASKNYSSYYTTSKPIKGFKKIKYGNLEQMI